MAWPSPSSGFQARGSEPTSIAWGTDGILNLTPNSGTTSSVIVKSVRSMRMIEEVKVENGTGITTTEIILNDGDQTEITVVDDRNISFPDSGTVIALLNPIGGSGSTINAGLNNGGINLNGPGGVNGTSNNLGGLAGTTELFQVINNDYNAARKQEGERVLLAKKYLLITASNTSS